MSAGPVKAWRSVLAFELAPSFKGPLVWAALVGLLLLEVPIWVVSNGQFSFNGQLIGRESRLTYVLWIGHSYIALLTTLLTLCLCLDRTGPHFLRNNDLLVLSRAVGRTTFYLAKVASVLVPSLLFTLVALGTFWLELYRQTGINHAAVFAQLPPLWLSLACLVSLYFLMRNYMGNFIIFFLWLLLLPFIYLGNIWRYFAPEAWREGVPSFFSLSFLPQFGGLHIHALGEVGAMGPVEHTWVAVLNGSAWTIAAAVAGAWVFSRKRL
jgi:hypothetical protein